TDAPRNTLVTVSPSDEVFEGGSVTLTCSSDANPPVEIYTWFKVNESSPVGSGQNQRIANVSSDHSGWYYCEARNAHGNTRSAEVHLEVRREYRLMS
ncbi:B-cell receptor CD22-like, partial [Clupea harengus]|uniref:B-cell receptor CD22-like n=1 Tax=Clupea harengus TaxID=7950 RepID=A0A6P8F1G1_CLUHA